MGQKGGGLVSGEAERLGTCREKNVFHRVSGRIDLPCLILENYPETIGQKRQLRKLTKKLTAGLPFRDPRASKASTLFDQHVAGAAKAPP